MYRKRTVNKTKNYVSRLNKNIKCVYEDLNKIQKSLYTQT